MQIISFIKMGNMQLQTRPWACGRGDVSTPSFVSHPISTKGGKLCPPYTGVHAKFWKPQARLNITKTQNKISVLWFKLTYPSWVASSIRKRHLSKLLKNVFNIFDIWQYSWQFLALLFKRFSEEATVFMPKLVPGSYVIIIKKIR